MENIFISQIQAQLYHCIAQCSDCPTTNTVPSITGSSVGKLWTHLRGGSGPHRTKHTHTHIQTNTRESMKECMRARKMRE